MKLSLKKGDGGGAEKTKPKAKAKRKSQSSGAGLASAKTFFASHGEKLVLGAIVLMSLYIVYTGFSKEGLSSGPEDVQSAIATAQGVIEAPTWTEVRSVRYAEPDKFDQQAEKDLVDVDLESFVMPMPLHPILQERRKRRADPKLVTPLELEVTSGYGPLAVSSDGEAGRGISELFSSTDQSRPLPDKYQNMKGESMLSGATTESRFFVCVTGLVPVRQQMEYFKEALAGAIEFAPERDTPKFLAVDIQRRMTQPDGQPADWESIGSIRKMRMEPRKWDGRSEELAASDHVIKPLVMPLPPLAFRDVSQWAVHSKIPVQVDEDDRGTRERDRFDEPVDEQGFDLFDTDGRGRNEGRSEPTNEGTENEENLTDEFYNQVKVDFGLMRYFDFDVEPGKSYQYRARFLLEDPNNPREMTRPSASACENDVIVRRQENPNKHYVESPWSEPSSTVVVPNGKSVYVGSVSVPTTRKFRNRVDLPIREVEPEATVIAVTWDANRAMDVPAEVTVQRGSVLNGTKDVEAIDPSRSRVVPLSGYAFDTDTIVLDITGGDMLYRKGREEVRAPGMMLLMDGDGRIHYHDELGDYEKFDFFTIPPEEVEFAPQVDEDENDERGERDRRGNRRNRGEEDAVTDEIRGRRVRGGR